MPPNSIADQIHDVFDFSQSRSSMIAWLNERAGQRDSKQVQGRTALFDAVLAATRILAAARSGDAIYAITDGGDNISHASATAVRKSLLESGIRLFVFLFADQLPAGAELLNDQTVSFKDVARATEGFVFGMSGDRRGMDLVPIYDHYDNREHAHQVIKQCSRALNIQVNGFYTLRIDSLVAVEKTRKVSVEVVDSQGKLRKDVAFVTESTIGRRPSSAETKPS